MAKKNNKIENQNEVVAICDNQQFVVANSCYASDPRSSGDHTNVDIKSMIRDIRGQQVMLDFDLAFLYGVETKVLNQAVKRNINRFPEDFMFKLTKNELETLRLQIVTSNSIESQQDSNWKSQIVTSNSNNTWTSHFATSNFAKMGLRRSNIRVIMPLQNWIGK